MAEHVARELGPVEALVNCAGVMAVDLLATQHPDEWRRVVDVNLFGTYHATRAVLPTMLRHRNGAIVNIVSPAGLIGSPGQTAYSASKAAIIGLTRSLAVECARRRVTINALSPGFLETPMTQGVSAAVKDAILLKAPLSAAVTPDTVAAAAVFILGARSMTGQTISVDGGMTI